MHPAMMINFFFVYIFSRETYVPLDWYRLSLEHSLQFVVYVL